MRTCSPIWRPIPRPRRSRRPPPRLRRRRRWPRARCRWYLTPRCRRSRPPRLRPRPTRPTARSRTACWTSSRPTASTFTARPCATATRARRWSVCSAACISSSTCTAPTAPLAISRRTPSSIFSARTTLTKPAWPTNPRRGFCSAPTPSRARSTCSPTSWWWISPTAAPTSIAGRATVMGSASPPSSVAWARPRRRHRKAPSRAPARLAGDGTTSRTSTVTPSTPGAYRAAYSSTRLHTAGPTRIPAAPPGVWAAPNRTAACA